MWVVGVICRARCLSITLSPAYIEHLSHKYIFKCEEKSITKIKVVRNRTIIGNIFTSQNTDKMYVSLVGSHFMCICITPSLSPWPLRCHLPKRGAFNYLPTHSANMIYFLIIIKNIDDTCAIFHYSDSTISENKLVQFVNVKCFSAHVPLACRGLKWVVRGS